MPLCAEVNMGTTCRKPSQEEAEASPEIDAETAVQEEPPSADAKTAPEPDLKEELAAEPKVEPLPKKAKAEAFVEVVIDSSLTATEVRAKSGSVKEGFAALKADCIEAISDGRDIFVSSRGGFVEAVYHAFNNHVPLCFGPDDLWTLIIQGVSKHIELNAEELRSKFVDFEGKKVLRIHRDHFVLGSPSNDWAGCFEEWSQMVADNIGKENTANLVPTFSTTGALEKALHELALMDCMKSYFELRLKTWCGISKVKLLGTHDDWLLLLEKVEGLRQYELGWWVDALMPILQKILKTYTGEEVDKIFWYTIYKQWSTYGSGGSTYVNGWITSFFPYVNGHRRHQFSNLEQLREDASKQAERGCCLDGTLDHMDVPIGVSTTPFIWEYHGAEIPMTIYGGFAGCEMDGEYIRPVLAWAVGKDKAAVYKQMASNYGKPKTWTTEALCKYLGEISNLGEQALDWALDWIRKNNITPEHFFDYEKRFKLMMDDRLPFDRNQLWKELSNLQRLAR
mmetsp:Transcript_43815/g.76305  ORF Transcript_43815/g.76305 Transcript_43815/m.76305 type:complete len:509 (-) Transcript_43815:243-1769(-)